MKRRYICLGSSPAPSRYLRHQRPEARVKFPAYLLCHCSSFAKLDALCRISYDCREFLRMSHIVPPSPKLGHGSEPVNGHHRCKQKLWMFTC